MSVEARITPPPGWDEAGGRLWRIVDPAVEAVAWLAPELGGNCIAYQVRTDGGWLPVLHTVGPAELAERPSRFGCPIMFPFPGHMRGARYTWQGVEYQLPSNVPAGDQFLHGFAHTHPWRVSRVGLNSIVAEFSTRHLSPAERDGYPFDVRAELLLRLMHRELTIELEAVNEGDTPAPVGLGLHPYFDPAVFGGDRAQARLSLPGQWSRLVRPVPTGELVAVDSPEVAVAPLGQTRLESRTGLERGAVVSLAAPAGRPRVTMRLLDGVRDLLVFTPAEHPSISIEPLSQAPSAASQPEGDPNGLVGLAPGERLRLAVSLAVELP